MTLALKTAAIAALSGLIATAAMAQSQSQLNLNAAGEAQAADRALNAQYTATMNGLSSGARTRLRAAQRAWIPFRDATCAYESSAVRGGSAEAMVRHQCMARMSSERTRDLRRYGQCPEGDISCPR